VRAQEDGYLTLANGYRAAEGSPVLTIDPALQAAARAYAADLATFGYFSHTGRDGSDPRTRARAQGYPTAGIVGENLIRLPASGTVALRGWQMSPPHNANLLNPAFTATGVAVVNSPLGPVWVQLFGTLNGCTTTSTAPAPTPEHLSVPLSAIGQQAVLGSVVAQAPSPTVPAPTDPVVAFVIDDVTSAAGQSFPSWRGPDRCRPRPAHGRHPPPRSRCDRVVRVSLGAVGCARPARHLGRSHPLGDVHRRRHR
jgi:hypothetical protein